MILLHVTKIIKVPKNDEGDDCFCLQGGKFCTI